MTAFGNHEVSGTTEVYGIIGDPVRHTLSPLIHNTLAGLLQENLVYVTFPLEKSRLNAGISSMGEVLRSMHLLGVKGMNVTVPYKETVIPYLAGIDPLAGEIGAVNTLKWTDRGYVGYNTDLPGLRRALKDAFEKHEIAEDHSLRESDERNNRQGLFSGKKAVVLGAGGAARSVLMLLQKEGAEEIWLFNRTQDKARILAGEMNMRFGNRKIRFFSAEEYEKLPEGKYVFFQCTSLGLKKEDGLLIDAPDFYRNAVFGYDLIYNPAETPFTRMLDSLHIPCENGLSMLLYQGVIAHEIWMDPCGDPEEDAGSPPEVKPEDHAACRSAKTGRIGEEAVKSVMTALRRELYGENIILVGYMGAGKSSVGKALSESTGSIFLDTDELIVEEAGMSIPEIFEKEGESGFRSRETAVLEKLRHAAYHTVIATGGGAVLHEVNRKNIMETGTVIFLSAEDETVFERVGEGENRPLLSGEEDLLTKIRRMQKERRPYYEAVADRVIVTDKKTVAEIAEEICT